MNVCVNDMVDDEGKWRWDMLDNKLPASCLLQIASYKVHVDAKDMDSCYWSRSSSGKISIKSVYLKLTNNEQGKERGDWRLVWGWRGPERVKTFLWLCFHGRLLTN